MKYRISMDKGLRDVLACIRSTIYKYLKLLRSDLVINHNNIIVMEWKLAEYKTIQGHTKGPYVSSLKQNFN